MGNFTINTVIIMLFSKACLRFRPIIISSPIPCFRILITSPVSEVLSTFTSRVFCFKHVENSSILNSPIISRTINPKAPCLQSSWTIVSHFVTNEPVPVSCNNHRGGEAVCCCHTQNVHGKCLCIKSEGHRRLMFTVHFAGEHTSEFTSSEGTRATRGMSFIDI